MVKKQVMMKKIFISNGFKIVYDRDLDEPLADGFYFTIAYPGCRQMNLLKTSLLWYKCNFADVNRK